jgi:quercetin dioxygenase-like cupin family protein
MSLSRSFKWVIMLAVLMLLVSQGVAYGQGLSAAPAPTVRYQSSFPVANAPAFFDELLLLVDVPTGASSPPHTHGGDQFITVLEGDLTRRVLRPPKSEIHYRAGNTYIEKRGELHEVVNGSKDKVRLLSTFLLPPGTPLTSIQQQGSSQLPPGPVTFYRSKLAVATTPPQFDVVQQVLDFVPGAWTAAQSHGGQALNMVIDGAVIVRTNGAEKMYKAGESWTNAAGQAYAVGNTTVAQASIAVSILLPKGASLTTGQAAAPAGSPSTLPTTGGAGQEGSSWWIDLLIGTLLLIGGLFLSRVPARS